MRHSQPQSVNPSSPIVLIGTSLRDHAVSCQFAELARQLSQAGLDVRLLVHGDHPTPAWLHPNTTVLKWASRRPTHLVDAHFYSRLLRQLRPACVIANFGATAIMMNVGALHRVPVRVYWHHTLSSQVDMDWPLPKWRLSLVRLRARLTFRLATHLVGNSRVAAHDLTSAYGVPQRNISVFWNALRDPLASAAINGGLACSGVRTLFKMACVGRFSASKGQDLLIRALPHVLRRFPGVQVEFLGGGETLNRCRDDAARAGLNGQCLFRGQLPHHEVLATMAAACLTVVPSWTEAFGLVNIESMAVGTPVIAARTGGIPEIVRDELDGLLFPPGDHQALADCILRLLENQELRSRMSANCRARFLEHFELTSSVCKQADWICGLIHAAQARGRGHPSAVRAP